MALAEVLFPPRAFPAESWCLGWMGAAEAEAVNPCRQCILFFIAHAWRLHHSQLLRQSTVLWAAFSLLPAQGVGRWCSEVQRPFPEVLSQWLYNLWVFNFLRISNWHLSCCLRTFHPCCLSGPFREQAGKLQVRDGWGWGELSTVFDHRARFSHSTQACGEEEKKWDQSQAFQYCKSDSRLGFHRICTGSLKVFPLEEFDIFQILSRADTTARALHQIRALPAVPLCAPAACQPTFQGVALLFIRLQQSFGTPLLLSSTTDSSFPLDVKVLMKGTAQALSHYEYFLPSWCLDLDVKLELVSLLFVYSYSTVTGCAG